MELVVILSFYAVGVLAFSQSYKVAKREDDEYRQNLSPAPTEGAIDDLLDQYRKARRIRRHEEKGTWDESYFAALPVTEHPDYFELDLATDHVDHFTQKSADGMICIQFESRANSKGVPYTLEIDHVTQMAQVSTGRISWEVPLSTLDKKQLPR